MKTKPFILPRNKENPFIAEKANRRSFLSKCALGSAGFLFLRKIKVWDDPNEVYLQIDILVDKYFGVYRTCSQTAFQVLNEIFNLDADNITSALASFPGLAYRGETCGVVTAGLLAIGLVYEENTGGTEQMKLSYEPSLEFCAAFENEFGTTRCEDVIATISKEKHVVSKSEDYGKLAQQGVLNHCPALLKKSLKLAADRIIKA